jgi:hypothetical protein
LGCILCKLQHAGKRPEMIQNTNKNCADVLNFLLILWCKLLKLKSLGISWMHPFLAYADSFPVDQTV